MSQKVASLLIRLAFGYLLIQMIVNAFRAGGWDFPVYHRTALHLLQGDPIYDLARDQEASFKYPPWIAPFFLPLSWFSLKVAAPIWQLFQVACAGMIFLWTRRHSRHPLTVPLSAVLYYGIFHVNILSGQVQLPLLALALLGYSRIQHSPFTGFSLLFFSLSTKIFNLFSLIGLPRGTLRIPSILGTMTLAGILGIPALMGFAEGGVFSALKAYVEVATSKTGNLRGAHQGLPGFFEWLSEIAHFPIPGWVAFGSSLMIAFFLFLRLKRKIRAQSQIFAVALALGAAIHPLAFSYSFTWTYPLGAFAVEHAFLSGTKSLGLRILATLGLFFLLVMQSGLISDRGILMPNFGTRAIGTLLLAWVLGSERDD